MGFVRRGLLFVGSLLVGGLFGASDDGLLGASAVGLLGASADGLLGASAGGLLGGGSVGGCWGFGVGRRCPRSSSGRRRAAPQRTQLVRCEEVGVYSPVIQDKLIRFQNSPNSANSGNEK